MIDKLWYWVQCAIWPFIRDTDCVYCIFLRGALFGLLVCALGLMLGAGLWLMR